MLQHRTIAKHAEQLATSLKGSEDEDLIKVLRDLQERHENEYLSMKQVEKEPTLVYQMFGKKTSELTPDEGRQYRAFLKRQRDAKKRELRKS